MKLVGSNLCVGEIMCRKTINISILIIGSLLYLCMVCGRDFTGSIIVLTTSILAWSALSNYYSFFDQKLFSKILCYSGILLSISMFFMFGIEEVPYPIGAIIFHQDGIAKTLGVLLVALIPVLLMSEDVEVVEQEDEGFESDTHTVFSQEDDSNWEVATDEDVDGGKFETV